MIPWAIDDLIISDDVLWQSALKGAHGLTPVSAQLAERFGRWPAFGGLTRPGRRLNLVTLWNHATHALRAAAKRQFEQYVSPEQEILRRLMAVNSVAPGIAPTSALLAVGPWDVVRSGSIYAPRDLLDTSNVATVSGGVIWRSGRFGEAMQIAEATTNYTLNPSAETTGNFAALGSATVTRDTGTYYIGATSYKIVTTAAVGDGMTLTLSALANAAHNVSFVSTSNLGTLQASLNGGTNWNTLTAIADSTNGWYVYSVNIVAAQANGSTSLRIRQSDATTRTIYLDAAQVEQKDYLTPYCDGSLGAGHSWSGTAHASTSSRTTATLTFPTSGNILETAGTVVAWIYVAATNGAAGIQRIFQINGSSAGSISLRLGAGSLRGSWGTANVIGGAVSLGQWHHVAMTYDGATLTLYLDGAVSGTPTANSGFSGMPATLNIGSSSAPAEHVNGLINDLCVFSSVLSTAQVATLYAATLAADQRPRWCSVIAEEVKAFAIGGEETDQGVVSTLAVDGDVRWRSRDGVNFWRVIAAADSFMVNNDGDDDAYPVIYFTPKTAKSGNSWAYKRWIPVKWRASLAATSYPVDICNDAFDTATLVTASKMQADGDDLRVKVDGVEVNRWLDGMDSASTKVFVNLNFQASQTATMAAIGDTTSTTLTATTDITNWPSTGILYIDTEAITYTGKSNADKQFTGCTRGAKGTTADTHAASATAYWIQHDIWILYGNAGAAAPTVDDNYKPMFELNVSTNTSWVYNVFGENDGLRTAAWAFVSVAYGAGWYTNNHATDVDPWDEIGIITSTAREGYFYLYNPCGITGASFTSGEKYSQDATYFEASIRSGFPGSTWTTQYTIPAPSVDVTWQAWASGSLSFSSSTHVGMQAYGNAGEMFGYLHYVEAGTCVVTLNSTYTPVIAIGAEQTNYDLAVTLTNSTTGDSVQIALTMQLNQTLEIDSDAKTITLLADNSRQMQALTLTGGARRDWLRLAAGNNTITWSDTGTVGVEVEVLFDRRYFE